MPFKSVHCVLPAVTSINHKNMGNNKIFIMCDASNKGIGAQLSIGTDWKSARPVAFKLQQLNPAQLNYPIHEKELLTIVNMLKMWHVDLLGMHFTILTNHRTLTSFNNHHDFA